LKIIGTDTQEFLNKNKAILDYVTIIDSDFLEAGTVSNYVVLTHLEIPPSEEDIQSAKKPNEAVMCLCFYFTNLPQGFSTEDGAKILSNHAEMLQEVGILMHFSSWGDEELQELELNPTQQARTELFERTVY
jgi:hypothetical protein